MAHTPLDDRLVRDLHRRANAGRWGVSVDAFASTLEASVARAFTNRAATEKDIERFLTSLHLEDLALACACVQGHDAAWEHFVREHRPVLYRAADALDSAGGARELADSLYAELFGLNEGDGERRSLFRYFHGRSSLATWLRAVLAQRYVDRLRHARRLDPLPADDQLGGLPAREELPPAPDRHRFLVSMQRAFAAAVSRLAAKDRLRLACYYAQDLTLSQIGRLLKEHEATASRHLARTRRAIREDVERQLRQEGMSEAEVAECFTSVVEDSGSFDLAEVLGGDSGRKTSDPERST